MQQSGEAGKNRAYSTEIKLRAALDDLAGKWQEKGHFLR